MRPARLCRVEQLLTSALPCRAPALPFTVIFASCFMCFFSVVIAFFKDIPDVKGDRLAAIQTLSVRNGVRMA